MYGIIDIGLNTMRLSKKGIKRAIDTLEDFKKLANEEKRTTI